MARFCPAGGGRGDSATLERYHGLAGRLGVWAVQICLLAEQSAAILRNREDEGIAGMDQAVHYRAPSTAVSSWDGPDRPLNMAGFRRVEKDPLTGEENTRCSSSCLRLAGNMPGIQSRQSGRYAEKRNACCPAATGNTRVAGSACRRSAKPESTASPPHPPVSEYHLLRVLKRCRWGQVVMQSWRRAQRPNFG